MPGTQSLATRETTAEDMPSKTGTLLIPQNINNLVQNKIQTAAYDSDHRALMLQITLPDNAKPPTKPPRPNTFNFKKTKWKKFSSKLQKNNKIQIPDDMNLDKTQIDSYIDQINTQLTEEMNRPRSYTEPPSFIISDSEAATLGRSEVDMNKYKTSNSEYSITTSADKTNILGAYFENINSPKQLNATSRIKTLVDNEIKNYKHSFDSRIQNPMTTFTNRNRATAPKHTEQDTKFFCDTTEVGNILRWKIAKIIPIHKKGKDPAKTSSYRPISLTPNISKVFEAIINNRRRSIPYGLTD
ncbi:hypothetical protein PV325_012981 [Microctonus aethiopoides]|nr:hypothetical protein PV325_012981 [Microctonus aethiopoides]